MQQDFENAEVWIVWSWDRTTENINVNIILGFDIFQLKYSTNPFLPTSFFVGFCFSFIKAHTIKYVHREVRNIWKHLKKVNMRLRISWVCWRHHCYSTGNVSSHLSAYQCSIPFCITRHQELEGIYRSWGHSEPSIWYSFSSRQ